MFFLFQIRHELRKYIGTIKVFGIPVLRLSKDGGLSFGFFVHSHFCQCHLLWFEGHAMIGFIDVIQDELHGCPVHNDMMIVYQQIEVVLTAHQTDMEEAVAIDVERHDKGRLECRHIINLFQRQREGLCVINGLHGLTFSIQFNSGEQRGMCLDCCLDSKPQAFGIKTTVQYI